MLGIGFGSSVRGSSVIIDMSRKGLDPTNTSDNLSIIQGVIDANIPVDGEAGGITMVFPDGVFKISGPIIPKYRNIRLIGGGRRNVQTNYAKGLVNEGPAVIAPVTGENAILLDNAYDVNGFQMIDISIVGTNSSTHNANGIEFLITGNEFRRDILLCNVTIAGFLRAAYLNKTSGTEIAFGTVKIINSILMHNLYVVAQVGIGTVQWNGFTFEGNEAGNNGPYDPYDCIHIGGFNLNINNNVFEGNYNAVYVQGGYDGVKITGNYFEANVGDYCIKVRDVKNAVINSNTYLTISATHRVLVQYPSGKVDVTPYEGAFPSTAYFLGHTTKGVLNTAATDTYLAVDYPDASIASDPNFSDVVYGLADDNRMINPLNGEALIAEHMTVSGAGLRTFTFGGLDGVAGDWAVASFLFEQSQGDYEPYISITPNGGNDPWDSPLSGFISNYKVGSQVMITIAKKLTATMTSLQVGWYPFGITPGDGLFGKFTFPTAYVVSDVNKIKHWLPTASIRPIAAPTTGTWKRGDQLRNRNQSSTVLGWACTADGTPGTWTTINN